MTELLNEGKASGRKQLLDRGKDILDTSDIVPAVNQVEFHPFLCREQMLRFGNKNEIYLESYSPLTLQNPLTRGKRLNHPNIVRTGKKHSKTSAQANTLGAAA